jgi:hypothetical protein
MTQNSLQGVKNNLNIVLNEERLNELETEAKIFNAVVGQSQKAQSAIKDWSGFFNLWKEYGPEIKIKKMIIAQIDSPISFSGWVNQNIKMTEFKDKLVATTQYFSEVDLPLKSIIQDKNGVEFNLNFKINKLP